MTRLMNAYRLNDDAKVDILVRGWNNPALTQACIDSIYAETDPALFNLIYVDNGSDSANFDQLKFNYTNRNNLTVIKLPYNHGSVRGINVGLSLAALTPAPFILLLDNDTEIPRNDSAWLERWLTYFEDEQVGAAGAVSDYVAGWQHVDATIDTYQKDWEIQGEGKGVKEPPDTPLLVSFAILLRKSAVLQTGMFDERFEPGMGEDYDYILRLRQSGHKAVVANSVWIHHAGSQTFGKMGFDDILGNSMQLLIAKWGIQRLKSLGVQLANKV